MSNTIQGLGNAVSAGLEGNIQKAGAKKDAGFVDVLKGMIDEAGQLQNDAQKQVGGVLAGDGQDLHGALIAMEKADLAFQMMMQVRNKIVQAYQEISRMPF